MAAATMTASKVCSETLKQSPGSFLSVTLHEVTALRTQASLGLSHPGTGSGLGAQSLLDKYSFSTD